MTLLAWPNLTDLGVLSGGAWQPALPLTALQDRVIAHPARSMDTDPASTQFCLCFDRLRAVQILALAGHTCSASARWRVTAADDLTFAALRYAGAWRDVWPDAYAYDDPDVAWEDENWWDRKPRDEEMGAFTALAWIYMPTAVTAAAWRIEIDDRATSAGYVDVGRLFMAPAWQPGAGASYGLTVGYDSGTKVETALGGTEYFDRRRPARSTQFHLDWLTPAERLRVLDLLRVVGLDGELFYSEDANAAAVEALRTTFLARLRQLSPLEYPYHDTHRIALELTELL